MQSLIDKLVEAHWIYRDTRTDRPNGNAVHDIWWTQFGESKLADLDATIGELSLSQYEQQFLRMLADVPRKPRDPPASESGSRI